MPSVDFAILDRFIGDAMGRGVTDASALAVLVSGRFGDGEGREALQAYRHILKGEIAKGESARTMTSDEIEYVARATAVDALIGDVLLAWPEEGDDA